MRPYEDTYTPKIQAGNGLNIKAKLIKVYYLWQVYTQPLNTVLDCTFSKGDIMKSIIPAGILAGVAVSAQPLGDWGRTLDSGKMMSGGMMYHGTAFHMIVGWLLLVGLTLLVWLWVAKLWRELRQKRK